MGDMADWVNDDSPEDDSRVDRHVCNDCGQLLTCVWYSVDGVRICVACKVKRYPPEGESEFPA